MKNFLKSLKIKDLLNFLVCILVAVILLLLCFLRSVITVSAINLGALSDSFTGWQTVSRNSAGSLSGSVSASLASYTFDIPFTWERLGADNISVGYEYNGVFINGVSKQSSFYYLYTSDYTYETTFRINLPDTWYGQVINGDLSVGFRTNQTSGTNANRNHIYLYQADGVMYQDPNGSDLDYTQRLDVSAGDSSNLPDSVWFDITPHDTLENYYRVNVHFNNFYVPFYYSSTNTQIDIPIDVRFNNVLAIAEDSFTIAGVSTATSQPISSMLLVYQPYLYASDITCAFDPAAFYLSNEYYTILQAMNQSNLNNIAGSTYLNSIDIESYCSDIKNLLSNWVGSGQANYIDFADFSQALLSNLGSLVSNTNVDYSTDLSTIIGYLANIYANQQAIASDVSDTESYCHDISEYMQYLYSFVTGKHIMHNSGSAGAVLETNNMYYLLYSLACGLTGDYQFSTSGQLDPDMAQLTYDRWVNIIRDAIGAEFTDSALRANIASVASQEAAYHAVEDSIWDQIYDVMQDNPQAWFTSYLMADADVTSAGVWWRNALESFYGKLGAITFIVSVVLVGGVLVLFLGRIRQFM